MFKWTVSGFLKKRSCSVRINIKQLVAHEVNKKWAGTKKIEQAYRSLYLKKYVEPAEF